MAALAALCMVAGSWHVSLPISEFTLRWTHSIERIEWSEDYEVVGGWLHLSRAHVRGSGAGMDPPEGAWLQDGVWSYRVPDPWRRELVPEIRLAMAHGRLPPTTIENTMQEFVDGKFDVLLSTNIVESGLDIRNANTMVIHRADMFGLAQLYQLRGRIGRGKTRAYAYLTVPPGKALNEAAAKRLEVMQTLDTLGAGFQLASHDLDIRGAGNLLGEEQSGHIREVGIELYQQLLEEAVEAARGQAREAERADWSPQLNLGIPVLIPEEYVSDLSVRMGLYRRIGALASQGEIDSFAAEMVDRFGKMPAEAEFLLNTVALKLLCRAAGVERIDAGEKAVVLSLHDNKFANPDKLIAWLQKNAPLVRLRPDHRVMVQRVWNDERQRLSGVTSIVSALAKLAA